MSEWLIIQTKPNQEGLASDVLTAAGATTYCPKVRIKRTHGRKVTMVERAFLARYIFLENAGVGSISGIRRHSSITAVVRIGEIPALIAGEVIDEIRSREIAGYIKLEEPAQTPCLFRPGQRVKITEGAYQGIGGVFYRRSGEQRALLFLRWFGRTTRAEIGLSSLVLA